MSQEKPPSKAKTDESEEVIITEDDIEHAIEVGRQRLGSEFAEILRGKVKPKKRRVEKSLSRGRGLPKRSS